MKAKAYFMAALNKILLLLNDRPTNVKRKFGCPFLSEHSKYLCDLLISCSFWDSLMASVFIFLLLILKTSRMQFLI